MPFWTPNRKATGKTRKKLAEQNEKVVETHTLTSELFQEAHHGLEKLGKKIHEQQEQLVSEMEHTLLDFKAMQVKEGLLEAGNEEGSA